MLQAVSEVFVMFILVFLAMLVSEKPQQNGCDKLGMEKMRFSYGCKISQRLNYGSFNIEHFKIQISSTTKLAFNFSNWSQQPQKSNLYIKSNIRDGSNENVNIRGLINHRFGPCKLSYLVSK